MRRLYPLLLTSLLLIAVLPALGQDRPDEPDSTVVDSTPDPALPTPAPGMAAPAPWIEPVSLLGATGQTSEPLAVPSAPVAPTLGGDWSNGAALGCILPLGATQNAAFAAGLAAPPPFDAAASAVEYAANLGLKFCAPAVFPPGDFAVPYDVAAAGNRCGYTFHQERVEGAYKNYLGFTLPWGKVFPGMEWGDFGMPAVAHWSTDVDVSVTSPSWEETGGDGYWLPVGVHNLTWRGDTVMSSLDFIPRYIPGWAWTRMNKFLKLKGKTEEAVETTLEVVIDLALDWGADKLDKKYQFKIPTWHTMYNEEIQRVAVTDSLSPVLSGPATTQIEAIEPGGVSQKTFLYLLRRGLTVWDNCDASPEVFAQNASSLPAFAPVGSQFQVRWVAEDAGPVDLSGAHNRSGVLEQTFVVADTLAPIILAPPDIVTETTSLPAPIRLGNPATFDLADLNPTVDHDACSSANAARGVVCSGGEIRFPAGPIEITWTATDHAGNQATAVQLVNVKALGANRRPSAAGQTGGNAVEATSFEPVTVTLRATDPDTDPLWFHIEKRPDNGFFHAPLFPYFIQDYRLANVGEIDFNVYCSQVQNRGQYVPTNWPVDARFMAVDDDGNVYVQDEGIIRCKDFDDGWSSEYRLAIFHPDGTWDEVLSDSDVKDMYVDLRNEILYTSRHNLGGTFSLVQVYDLDLNPIATYRTDSGQQPFREPKNVVIDPDQSLLYVTNGYYGVNSATLWLMHLPPASDPSIKVRPEYLATYTVPGVAAWQDLALDSAGNLYASERDGDRIYKWRAATRHADGSVTPGELIGWIGRCDSGPGCDQANGRSFGYSCTDSTCAVPVTSGSLPGQFDFPRGIALDSNDILYVTDYQNQRVQRFTPDGHFAGQAISECDGSCFVLGDFGYPKQVTVNSDHFYVLDDYRELLHVFETTPLTRVDGQTAEIVYQSENNFVGTETFSFRAGDGLDLSPPATVAVNVSRNYRPPVALGPLSVTTIEDNAVELPVDGYDPDGNLDTLTYMAVDPPANGTFSRQGNKYTYTPDPDFAGTDRFTYAASDGVFRSEPQEVMVTITPVNDPPSFPEDANQAGSTGFIFRTAGTYVSRARFAPLAVTSEPLAIGRGFNTLFSVSFSDPDDQDVNMVTVDWGDGSAVEKEGKLLDDGTMTGPVLGEGVTGGEGSITAEHVFQSTGDFTVEVCVSDNAAVDGDGNKSTTSASTTSCRQIPVSVSPMVDILVDIRPSANPVAAGGGLAYELVVTNNAPESGSGLSATGLVLTDTLSSYLQVSRVASDDGHCSQDDNVVVCDLNALAPGAAATISIDTILPAALGPGEVVANHAAYRVDQQDQADVQENGELTTVVAPADFIVNTIADDPDETPGDGVCATAGGDCSLRAAVSEANDQPGAQTISLADWQFLLDRELVISDDLTITGLGAGVTIIAGRGTGRLFSVAANTTVALDELTLQGGEQSGDGGALYNAGAMSLSKVQISGNHASGTGGAVYNQGTMQLVSSAVTGNSADAGAGAIANSGVLTLQNVTISGNQGVVGGIASSGEATLTNVTVARNRATADGGGLSGSGANFTLSNTILAGNIAAGSGANCHGGLTSQGHNLFGLLSGCSVSGSQTGDIMGEDPRLEVLDLNGGPTLSHALKGGSPAIDAGACTLPTDQRDEARPRDGDLDGNAACDIGAYEFEPSRLFLPVITR